MATFSYKAVTKDGRIVTNKIEEGNRLTLIKKLKSNGLYTISVIQKNAKRTRILKRKKKIFRLEKQYKKQMEQKTY